MSIKRKPSPGRAMRSVETLIGQLEIWQGRYSEIDGAGYANSVKNELFHLLEEVRKQASERD